MAGTEMQTPNQNPLLCGVLPLQESTIQGRALYQQVESEMERESLDARRVRHLKAQIVQLERQVNTLM